MYSSFNSVKWETLTYLDRYHWHFSFKKWTTYQSYGARPENKNRWGLKKRSVYLNIYSNMLVPILHDFST